MVSFTANGIQIGLFIKQLTSDPQFEIGDEMTPAYLEGIGDELELEREETIEIINKMIELGILKLTKI